MKSFAHTASRFLFSSILTLVLAFAAQPAQNGTAAAAALVVERNIPISALKHSYSRERSDARYATLSKEDKDRFMAFYRIAGSNQEKHYLDKALSSGHAIEEIERFAAKIRGKGDDWLRNMLRLTNSKHFRGIQQQWKHSCGPTTVMALLGELDPLYSYRVHAENYNFYYVDDLQPTKYNPRLADEQKRMLEKTTSHQSAGKAVGRKANGGAGRWILDLLNEHTSKTGLHFTWKQIGSSYTVADSLEEIQPILDKRIAVPMVVRSKDTSHCVLVTGIWREGGLWGYNVHDPWTGKTLSRSHDQFLRDTLSLSGNNTLQSIYLPSIVALI